MVDSSDFSYSALRRIVLCGLGTGSALALWVLSENWNNPAIPPAVMLALVVFVLVYSSVSLVLVGPVTVSRALLAGLWLALPITFLVTLAGFRHVQSTDLLDEPVTLAVAAVLVAVSTPFVLVRCTQKSRWLDYTQLFDAAWTIFVRYLAAWVFAGVFWMVLFLSNQLLKLVDVQVIEFILRRDWLVFGLTGGMLGLGMAVVFELRDTISPHVILRLLRLLVPVILLVVVVFLGAALVQGQAELFAEFSAAGILMGAAIVSITLVNTALDRSDRFAVTSRGLKTATRILAMVLPLLAALAVWAVVVRVRQYGWTPDRILACCTALFLLMYGIVYFVSAVSGSDWMSRIRRANTAMALLIIAIAVLWMTPALNVYRISINSQVNRFVSGQSTLDQLPFWEMAKEWGNAGHRGLDQLSKMTGHKDFQELRERIENAKNSDGRYEFRAAGRDREAEKLAAELSEKLLVLPGNGRVEPGVFAELEAYTLRPWVLGCRNTLPDGRAGCAMMMTTLLPTPVSPDQAVILYVGPNDFVQARLAVFQNGVIADVRRMQDPLSETGKLLASDILVSLLDGGYDVQPSGINALVVNGARLIPSQ